MAGTVGLVLAVVMLAVLAAFVIFLFLCWLSDDQQGP